MRLTKILGVAAVLYWLIHFLSTSLKIAEGIASFIVYIAFFVWMKIQQAENLRRSGMDEIDQMNEKGTLFEKRIAMHFQDLGWDAYATKESGDFGGDVIATSPTGDKVVIQCKCHKEGNPVRSNAVTEALGAIRVYKVDSAMVITNRHLTDHARKLARMNDVEVWEREDLAKSLALVTAREQSIINDLRSIPTNKFRKQLGIIWQQFAKLSVIMVKAFKRALK